LCTTCAAVAVIPEGVGLVKSRELVLVTGLGLFPGLVRAYAGEGSGSRLDRRSTRQAWPLTPAPSGAESSCRERGYVVGVAVFSNVRCGRSGGTGGPVAGHPFATGWGTSWPASRSSRASTSQGTRAVKNLSPGVPSGVVLGVLVHQRSVPLRPAPGWVVAAGSRRRRAARRRPVQWSVRGGCGGWT
jgi:hypothetical protein